MEYKVIDGANKNKYAIYCDGIVKSLGRIGARGYIVKDKILTQHDNSNGYLRVFINLDGKSKGYFVHRLVAEAFIPNIDNLPVVNHKDGDKHNNNVDNLEWTTASRNNKHAFDTGLKRPTVVPKGEQHWRHKLTYDDVVYIREHYIPGDKEFGQCALARKFNTSQSNIYGIVNYNTWKICLGGDKDEK